MSDNTKKALVTLVKGVIPLVYAFIVSVVGGFLGGRSDGATVAAIVSAVSASVLTC